nr:orf76 [Escherichia coli B171]
MLDTCICSFIMRKQPETVLKRLEQAACLVTALWSRPLLTLKCASVPPVRRPPRVTCNWLINSARASMPSCLGIAPRRTAPRILKWHCARPGRRSARTIRRLPGLKLEDWVN